LAGGNCGLNKSEPFDFSFGRRQVHVTTPGGNLGHGGDPGVTAGSHCVLTPTNAAAAANIASVFVSSKAAPANTITIAHAATADMTYDIACTAN
jgi:hypothetical protein